MKQRLVVEGDTCPECGEGLIEGQVTSLNQFRMKCDRCGAIFNDRGERVPCDNVTVGY